MRKARTASLRRRLTRQVKQLDAMGIVIVSNNCVPGILYEWAELPKQSPTAGLYFSGNAYGRFLNDLASGRLNRWLEFDEASLVYNDDQSCWSYPVAGGGQLVFLHYTSCEEAISKWRRRIERLDGRTLLIVSSIQGGITLKSLREPLAKLPLSFTVDGNPS
ncbi:MAG TPA: DUF1919 domain-containing protein, partial [Bradyrhizobium sp.]|uniref:DUF1919 domain-containing protein n=1 Tax=Bradyrhizobium sp. TaxID=376 RepID=UPI002B479B43